jgi:general secretion pathway protein K
LNPRRGFVLLAALWLLAALSAALLVMSVDGRGRRSATYAAVSHERERAALMGGLIEVMAELQGAVTAAEARLDPASDPWVAAPGERSVDGVVPYRVVLRDPHTALHLNQAGEAQLVRLLVALDVEARRASQVANAILDWSDPDDHPRPGGAERKEYLDAGRIRGPGNRPFHTVEELQEVLGIDPSLYRLIAPHLTVVGTGRVNIAAAPRPVLLTLPGFSEEAVRVLERRRARGRMPENIFELALELSPENRQALEREFPRLAVMTTASSSLLHADLVALSPLDTRVEALLVRSGARVQPTWLRWR